VMPEVEHRRGVANRITADAGVRKSHSQLLVLRAPAEPFVVSVDADDVVQEGGGVSALPWRPPRGYRLDQPPHRFRQRVAALVARGAFVPARVDRLGRERRGNLARKANDSACGEASAPSDLDVPGEQ